LLSDFVKFSLDSVGKGDGGGNEEAWRDDLKPRLKKMPEDCKIE